MRSFKDSIINYRDFVRQYNNIELFLTSNDFFYFEYSNGYLQCQHKIQKGIALRVFLDEHTEFYCSDGLALDRIKKLWEDKSVLSRLPMVHYRRFYGALDPIQTDILEEFFDLSTECSEKDINIFKDYGEAFCEKYARVKRLCLQYKIEKNLLLSSYGQEGFSKKSVFSPSIELDSGLTAYHIAPCRLSMAYFEQLYPFLEHRVKIIDNYIIHADEYILLSKEAVAILFYCLGILLTKDLIIAGNSVFTLDDIGKKYFDSKITLEENSPKNRIIVGNVDGEGSYRVPCNIIEKGYLTRIFSDYSPEFCLESTGSSYRFLHTEVPYIKPSKIFVEGQDDLNDIFDKYEHVLKVDELNGIIESLDPKTSEFTAYSNAIVFEQGVPVAKTNIRLSGKITELFKEVECIFNDYHYGVDGSIYIGSVLIKNKNYIVAL